MSGQHFGLCVNQDNSIMNIETIRFRNIVSVLPHASTINPRPDQQRGTLKT